MPHQFNISGLDIKRTDTPTRRRFCMNAAALAAVTSPAGLLAVNDDVIRIGQSIALTGPLADLGKALNRGAQVCFAAVNARGGIHGRRIELVERDDGYDVARSVENVNGFLRDPSIFGLFSCMGTPMIEALLPLIKNTDVPCFAPFTGAGSARPDDMRNVLNVRPGYTDETESLIEHLATIGLKKIAVVYQNNSFGKEILLTAETAIAKYGLNKVASTSVQTDASDAAAAAATVHAANPEAVLIGLAGKPTISFVKSVRSQRRGLPLYALSVAAATLSSLGDDARGITVSQVVPLPTHIAKPVVRDFLQVWQSGVSAPEPTHLALEGYINARVFAEVLRRTGRSLTRKSFIDTAWSIKHYNIGGLELNFDRPGRNASRFVELTMIGLGGRFIR